jgi:CheY-like chemotaxis protein
MFSVKDTGIGIKEEDIPKLFTYFTQLENFLTKRFRGTGLGLAICKRLVELMEGEISVESEYGKGSTFYFTCLARIPKGEALRVVDEKVPSFEETTFKLKILLVEDDHVSQLVIKQLCKLKGWYVSVATNGKEALEFFEENNYDLILMDIQMPEISGYDLTYIIREKERLEGGHVPIIATTAYVMKQDKERCKDAGMDDFISKPIDMEIFYEVVERLINKLVK